MSKAIAQFKGYDIYKSGRDMVKVCKDGEKVMNQRYMSVEGAKAAIVSQGRVMTRREYAMVYDREMAATPTAAQVESERMVAAGEIEGFA